MKIAEFLSREAVYDQLRSQAKEEVLRELVEALGSQNKKIGIQTVVDVLLEREKLGSTGIGDGVAIPHGKLPDLDRVMLSFGRSLSGVPFDSLDEKPVHIFFLLIAPENSTGIHLKVLARISRLLKDADFRKRLMAASDADELYRIIIEEDEKY